MNILQELKNKFTKATVKSYPNLETELDLSDIIQVTQSTQEKFGHYQFNSAMRLSKVLKKSPRDIAQEIVAQVDTDLSGEAMISKTEVAGPGFVNITIDPLFITESTSKLLNDNRLGTPKPEKQKVIVEFSSPNTAKELHVGHLRSSVIGDSLARLFEFLGVDVLRLNHVGDWGTAFGMLIAYIKAHDPKVLTHEKEVDLSTLVSWYKLAKKKFDEDEEFKTQSRLEVVALQGGDEASLKAWETICDISRKAYGEIYDLLDITIQERGESFYNPFLPGIVEDLEKKNLITVSDGAKCVFLDGFINREGDPLPMIVQKTDGGFNYSTTDMAAIRQRTTEEKADRIIYVVDAGQATHFQMIFGAAEKAGYLDPAKTKAEHVAFGLVLGPDGKKFKTRSGETERLIDLLQNAVDKAKDILDERISDGRMDSMGEEEEQALAKALGINAIKYADLSCHRTGDYTFSYDRMLQFEGNTAAFLMYAYVRIAGIKRKVGINIEDIHNTELKLEHPTELALGLHLTRFAETIEVMARDLTPNRLTDYLYELAGHFNAFFRDCRVEGVAEQNSRLILCEIAAQVLKKGLNILGLKTVERM